MKNIHEELMTAVSKPDLQAVRKCLEQGADPDYTPDGLADPDPGQPASPLSLVMFRISDCMLGDAELKQFAEIARLLVRHGADPEPAMRLAEDRYGKYDPGNKGMLMDIWKIVAGDSQD